MSAEEFVLIPRHLYARQEPLAARILDDANIHSKSDFMSLLQRERRPPAPPTDPVQQPVPKQESEYLKELSVLGPKQKEKAGFLLQKIESSPNLGITNHGTITVNGLDTEVSVSTFLYLSQQENKKYSL